MGKASRHPHAGPSRLGWLALLPLALFVSVLAAFVRDGLPLGEVRWAWVPSLGVELTVRLDGLSVLFLLLISGVGTMVFVYAAGYLAEHPRRRRLFLLLTSFVVAMVGCVTADDLIALFVFWELTSLTSFLLVGFEHESASSRSAARQALLVTAAGGLVLLAGILLLGQAAQTYSIRELLASAPRWRDRPLVTLGLVCVFVGAFTKSAQFPFHFWLPNAMAAPTPVSAYLHSATMVKLGIYLLARLHPAFCSLELWQVTLVVVGGVTSIGAMLLVLQERDLKRILAWSTVSSLGTLVLLIGLPGEGAATAVAAFLVAHALYKAPLFFVAGNVDHGAGTRDIGRLAGLARSMPWTAVAALLAGLSMAGVPLSFGFVAKDLIKIAKDQGDAYTWVAYGGVLVSALSIAVAAVAAIRIFWHAGGEAVPSEIAEVPRSMRWPPIAIASLGILFGVLPRSIEPLLLDAARAMRPGLDFAAVREGAEGGPAYTAFGLSLVLGALFFLGWDRLHAGVDRLRAHVPRGLAPQVWYEASLAGLPVIAGLVTRRLQTGVLRQYVALLVLFVAATVALALGLGGAPAWPSLAWPSLAVGGTALGIVVASLTVCVARDPFVVLLVSGLIGLGCALFFLFLGAPDVAFTQFAVEVAFVVVIASILLRLRRLDLVVPPADPVGPRLLPSLVAGVGVAALTVWAVAGPSDPALAEFFGATSLTEAHGRNVVNVILVDYRALDTLGEVSVVAVTFLAALPLLKALRRPPGGAER